MEVYERDGFPQEPHMRFYAVFRGADIRTGEHGLLGVHGNGATVNDAILDYAHRISGELLIVDAMLASRREIQVPTINKIK